MTEMLYFESADACYIKEFDAVVEDVVVEDKAVVLDRTAFYPTGGGQEHDTGTLSTGDREYKVTAVRKRDGRVLHYLDTVDGLSPGTQVRGEIDWDRRYGNMRMHTAQHLVSAIVKDLYGADTVGNQLYPDRARIDFSPLDKDTFDASAVEERFREMIAAGTPVRIYQSPREDLLSNEKVRVNMSLIPEHIRELRTVEIEGYDICPCAGTHVKSLGELAPIKVVKTKSKGSGKLRVEYQFVE